MKHIKYFEHKNDKKYWLLPTDDRFEKALKKIGYTIGGHHQNFLENHPLRGLKYVFIGFDSDYDYEWGWMDDSPKSVYDIHNINDVKSNYYENQGYKFSGVIDADEIQKALIADKYNL
jgi:hypothetical protein